MVSEVDKIGGALEFLGRGEGIWGKFRVEETGVGVEGLERRRGDGH